MSLKLVQFGKTYYRQPPKNDYLENRPTQSTYSVNESPLYMKGQFLNLARQLMNVSVCFFDVLATAEAFYRDNKNKIVNYHNACVGVRDSAKVILILWFVYKI